ncbi:MAG TPA: cysteine desulfurase [Cyanobacteria bacterium UBA8530]|nr:cysteine desulfurase [Cyanobacteria bacterium UBA8530]
MIYLNNAATSFPKPPEVLDRIRAVLAEPAFCLGRAAGNGPDILMDCRKKLARLLGVSEPTRIILTPGTTYALNLAIQGACREGGVLTTALEHNSVLRPLEQLRRTLGLEVEILSYHESLDPEAYKKRWKPSIRVLALSAASNVNGAMPPLEAIADFCRERDLTLILDAAQGAGSMPMDVKKLPPKSLVALAGHKGLYGPQGTGALYLGEGIDDQNLRPLIFGGTGVNSESPLQPLELPLRFESGTMNLPGFAGLSAGLDFLFERGLASIALHKERLIERLTEGLREIPGLAILYPPHTHSPAGVLAFTLEDHSPSEIGDRLYEAGIIVRAGLHCAPLIHKDLGCPGGSVRLSVGIFNREEEIDSALEALRAIRSG